VQRRIAPVQRHGAVLQHRQVEQVVEQPRQPDRVVMDDGRELLLLLAAIGPSDIRISENARIEVIGVRSSWLIWLRKASFWIESWVSFSLASRSWRAVRPSSRDFCLQLARILHDLLRSRRPPPSGLPPTPSTRR
jgi:hypothetical protein